MTDADLALARRLAYEPVTAYEQHHVPRIMRALLAELAAARQRCEHLVDRCAAASGVIGRIADRQQLTDAELRAAAAAALEPEAP